jgi:GT2 family glycosyltransferase
MSFFSVVTICYNNIDELKKTCQSVDRQSLLPYEHIIVNGSTSSKIKDWLMSFPQPAFRKWINEPDKGIADAFNKGIEAVEKNTMIQFLNSGDTYANDNVLRNIAIITDSNEDIQWVSGKVTLFRGNKWVTIGKPFEKEKLYRGMRSISHQTIFIKKAVYDHVGGYNRNYKIAMDYDLLCRITDKKYQFLDFPIAVYDTTGISSTQYLNGLKESRKIYESYYGFSLFLILWHLRLKLLYVLMQSPFGEFLYSIKTKLKLENI